MIHELRYRIFCLHACIRYWRRFNLSILFTFTSATSEKETKQNQSIVFISLVRNCACGRKCLWARGFSKQVKSHDTNIRPTKQTKKEEPSAITLCMHRNLLLWHMNGWYGKCVCCVLFTVWAFVAFIYICRCKQPYAWHSNCETDMDTLDTNNNWFYAYKIRKSDQVFHFTVYRWLISILSLDFLVKIECNCTASIFKVNVIMCYVMLIRRAWDSILFSFVLLWFVRYSICHHCDQCCMAE